MGPWDTGRGSVLAVVERVNERDNNTYQSTFPVKMICDSRRSTIIYVPYLSESYLGDYMKFTNNETFLRHTILTFFASLVFYITLHLFFIRWKHLTNKLNKEVLCKWQDRPVCVSVWWHAVARSCLAVSDVLASGSQKPEARYYACKSPRLKSTPVCSPHFDTLYTEFSCRRFFHCVAFAKTSTTFLHCARGSRAGERVLHRTGPSACGCGWLVAGVVAVGRGYVQGDQQQVAHKVDIRISQVHASPGLIHTDPQSRLAVHSLSPACLLLYELYMLTATAATSARSNIKAEPD